MRIIQLTDLHIGKEGEESFGVDVRQNFRRILGVAQKLEPDYLVLSGDLCLKDGERDVYQWVRQQVETLEVPYEVISGNHDDPELMAVVFDKKDLLREGELYFERRWKGRPVLFLDTTEGEVSAPQLEWLRDHLETANAEPILFMHHPPVFGGVPHMDRNYALQNQSDVQEVLFGHSAPVHVFTGHYHVDKIVQKKNVSVYITPACYFQIDQHQDSFEVDHRRPGLREIVLRDDILLSTTRYA